MAESKRLQRQQDDKREELANQARGKPPSTDEGKAKKEKRKEELQGELANLAQQIERYQGLLLGL